MKKIEQITSFERTNVEDIGSVHIFESVSDLVCEKYQKWYKPLPI